MELKQQNLTSKVQSINIKETLDKRFCDLVFSLLGKEVKVKEANQVEGDGLLYTINPKNGGLIVKNYKQSTSLYPGEEGYVEQQAQAQKNITKSFNRQDFVYLFAENVDDPPFIQDFQNLKNNKAIKTDRELTKLDKSKGRQFQAVDFIFGEDGSLDEGEELNTKAKQSSFKQLDQFQINQQKFGVGTDFKDEYYTTKLDISKLNKEQIQLAEKLEQEVLKEGSKNKHVLIDRGRDDLLDGSDEEKHFSAVHGSGRYTEEGNVVSKNSKKDQPSSQTNLGIKDASTPEQGINFGKGRFAFSKNNSQKSSDPNATDSNNQAIEISQSANNQKYEEKPEEVKPNANVPAQGETKQNTEQGKSSQSVSNGNTVPNQDNKLEQSKQEIKTAQQQLSGSTANAQQAEKEKQSEQSQTTPANTITTTQSTITPSEVSLKQEDGSQKQEAPAVQPVKKKLQLKKKDIQFDPTLQQEDKSAAAALAVVPAAVSNQYSQQITLNSHPYENAPNQDMNYAYVHPQQYQPQYQQYPVYPPVYNNMMQYPPQQQMFMPPPNYGYVPNMMPVQQQMNFPPQNYKPKKPFNSNNNNNPQH